MTTYLILHGSGGNPEESWFPWLKQKLEAEGQQVFIPQFPNTPETQTMENWLKVLENYPIDENTIAIGHSLGVAFLLNLLERRKLAAVYLVAGFTGLLGNEFDPAISHLADRNFNWKAIRSNSPSFHVFYSNDDPYVKPEKAFTLGEKLGVEPILIQGAGHFNTESGFVTFEELYEKLRS